VSKEDGIMNAHRRQLMVIALVGMIALVQWGCALKQIGGPSLEEVRAQVGVVGVTSSHGTPNADLSTPSSGKGVAALKGAAVGAVGGATPGAAILNGLRGCSGGGSVGAVICGTIALFGLSVAAAGGTIGALVGPSTPPTCPGCGSRSSHTLARQPS
jgi:hypothetical protein